MRLDPETFNEISLSLVPLATAPGWVKSLWVEKELQSRGLWQDAVFDHVRPFLVPGGERETHGGWASKGSNRAQGAALAIDDGGGSWKSLISKSGEESVDDDAQEDDGGLTPAQADLASIMHIIAVCAREVEPQVQEFAGPGPDTAAATPESPHEVEPVEPDESEETGISWADELRNPTDVEPTTLGTDEQDSLTLEHGAFGNVEATEEMPGEGSRIGAEVPGGEFAPVTEHENSTTTADDEATGPAEADTVGDDEPVRDLGSIEWIMPTVESAEAEVPGRTAGFEQAEAEEPEARQVDGRIRGSADESNRDAPGADDSALAFHSSTSADVLPDTVNSRIVESAAEALRSPEPAGADGEAPFPGDPGRELVQPGKASEPPVDDSENASASRLVDNEAPLTESIEPPDDDEDVSTPGGPSAVNGPDATDRVWPMVEAAIDGLEDVSTASSAEAARQPFVEPVLTLVPDQVSVDPVEKHGQTDQQDNAVLESLRRVEDSDRPQDFDSADVEPEGQPEISDSLGTTDDFPVTAEHEPVADHSTVVEFEADAHADDQEAEVRAPVTPLFPEHEVHEPATVQTGTEQATQLQLIPDDEPRSSHPDPHAESRAEPSSVVPFTTGSTGTEGGPAQQESEQLISVDDLSEQQAKPEVSPVTPAPKQSSPPRKRSTASTGRTAASTRPKSPKSSPKPKTRASAKKTAAKKTDRGTSRLSKPTTVASRAKSTKPKTGPVAAQSRKPQRATKQKARTKSRSVVKPVKTSARRPRKAPKPLVTTADAAAVADMFGIHIDTASLSDDVRLLFFGAVVKANQGDWEASQERLQAALESMGDSARSRIWRHVIEQSLKIKHRLDQHAA